MREEFFQKKKKKMREGLTINYHKLDSTNSTVLKMVKLQVTIFMRILIFPFKKRKIQKVKKYIINNCRSQFNGRSTIIFCV